MSPAYKNKGYMGMENHYHGYSTSALMSEAWFKVYKRHKGDSARNKIAEMAFDLYQAEVLPQYQSIKLKSYDDPVDLAEAKAKKIDDFASENRTINWRDGFEVYVARAIDHLYGYKYSALIRDILFPPQPVASSAKDLTELFNKSQREHTEATIKMAEHIFDGLENDSEGELLDMRRELCEALEPLSSVVEAIDNELVRKKGLRIAS